MRRSFSGARCLVTGASSGLGKALAEALVHAGAHVIMTGRSAERLETIARSLTVEAESANAPAPIVVAADLTVSSERLRLVERANQEFGGALDVLINCAGVGAYGRFESHDESVTRQVFEINTFAPMAMCWLALPMLRRGTKPAVVNIGSIVARRGLPGRSEYSASKHAIAGFTEAIRAEWSRDGIDVLLVNPGFTATEFDRNLVADTAVYNTSHRRTMTAEQVARATLRALSKRKHEVTLSPPGKMLILTNRLLPRFVDWGLGRWTKRLYSRNADTASPETPPPPVAPNSRRG